MNKQNNNLIETYVPQNEIIFSPIGGVGQIGMNFYLYGTQGKWVIVDLGITFGNAEETPGIDIILPNPEFVKKNKKNLLGIVITHAHEDHIGAVGHLWPQLQCPVFATPFASAVLRRKLKELKIKPKFLKTIGLDSNFKLGPFAIDVISTTHSIPEPNALGINTKFGSILHTGDWKIDPKPLVGKNFNQEKMKSFGKKGVLAIVSDSTNSNVEGHSGSEEKLRESLIKIIKKTSNRIAITSFSSNLARLETFAHIAKESGRVAALCGRSLWTMYKAAMDTGYLKNIKPFLDEREIMIYPKDQVLLICTGSQGEPRAALSRIASDNHQNIFLEANDTVIFSSKVIPGNERAITKVQNELKEKNINVVTESDEFVHVSGHPHVEELKKMYNWIKPEIVIPVHGEYHMLKSNVEIARKCGVKKGLILKNGLLLKVAPGEPKVLGSIASGRLMLDGKRIIPINEEAIKNRKKMLYNGTILISLLMNKTNKLISKPVISSKGFFNNENIKIYEKNLLSNINPFIKELGNKNFIDDLLKEKIKSFTHRFFRKALDMKPVVQIHIIKT
ncbi:MAG: Ribonuclease J1 [Alphaproteobacteria bacterium MarineAlpha6_Bin6]|nr:MBL fold hydrolase [Pelagibacteraceae bacterium]PPR32343.1 MAG: Ribonuclease J1 [Alphaproteobacteria bacterium MarineAlpha6_Bin6]PPR32951.1 MAG: Ribonuclease J1 [Alphaproteobacteria bacterium MarineAlpha6_Bin5]|tara:strand:- start:1902 stop:3584 length:1683 start_codon:yes stop_codon:yes gene_type:complete